MHLDYYIYKTWHRASLIAQLVKNPPSMQETLVRFELGKFPGEGTGYPLQPSWDSLMAQMVKNLPAMQETWAWSLGREDPLEKGMVTHSSSLTRRIPWSEEPGGLQSVHRVSKSRTWLKQLSTHTCQIQCANSFILFILWVMHISSSVH